MKSSTTFLLQFLFLSLTHLTIFSLSTSQPSKEPTSQNGLEKILQQISQWRNHQLSSQNTDRNFNTIIAWILSFIASSVSSACGIGGGSLFLPILTIVAGLSLKSATAVSSFMVAAGALANVIYALCFLDKSLVNYEITLLSEPCMLLGVSIGVLCNIMFPEWLITALFAVVLASSTAMTVQSGCKIWSAETEEGRVRVEVEVEERESEAEVPLLMDQREGKGNGDPYLVPWKDVMVLVMIWMCFFVLHIILGDKNGKGVIDIKPCGVTYWLITISQIPIAIGFTSYILYTKRKEHEHKNHVNGTDKASVIKGEFESLPRYVFPVAGILTGALSGLFGIGGGLILNPVFLQIGVPPQTAAATSSLMVLFLASMSMVQYILLGMKRINEAVMYGLLCFLASTIGLVAMHRVIAKSGRVSLVVFMVSAVMALSTVIITLFGALDVWRQITNGDYMGFKLLC
ncbi:Sulfite exporter TauE/SafE [Carex littledalei]|uniref:Sulfite exporter TauE/SafE n=1 Tax=Carex littledalei TaxID=544730 RepID=A0A833QI00_9POAL|nr:Sulfite exporter TauE/SafE [Carex littledalei]